jgi:hypothetical protein
MATQVCREQTPQLAGQGRQHSAACHHPAIDLVAGTSTHPQPETVEAR